MTREVQSWLLDMLNAIDEIDNVLPANRDFFRFQKDLKTKRAVERNLEIIGEALNRILKVDPTIQISHKQKIIGARNRIIHGYDKISDEVIWGIVNKSLPVLKSELTHLLNTM